MKICSTTVNNYLCLTYNWTALISSILSQNSKGLFGLRRGSVLFLFGFGDFLTEFIDFFHKD